MFTDIKQFYFLIMLGGRQRWDRGQLFALFCLAFCLVFLRHLTIKRCVSLYIYFSRFDCMLRVYMICGLMDVPLTLYPLQGRDAEEPDTDREKNGS